MKDFGEKYRQVVYFGINAEETADDFGRCDAWNIVVRAVWKTIEEDVRSDDLEAALVYLRGFATRDRPFQDFRDALGICDPFQRGLALRCAANRIRQAFFS